MSFLWLERNPQSHLFPSCMAFWGTPDGINLALLRVLSCDETNYNIAMITQNVLAPKTNMGKYLRGGIVGLFVGPKEKKLELWTWLQEYLCPNQKLTFQLFYF